MNREPVQVSLLLLVGFLLRCLLIGTRGIWYDDAFSILLSRQTFGQIIQGTAADTMPPLYYFLLHVWMQISGQIWWLRLLSVLTSMGGLGLLYVIIRRTAGQPAAFWALLWGVVSPFQIYHAQELRMYALLQLFQAGYVLFFLIISQSERRKWWMWAGFILGGALSLYTHNLAVFFLPAVNLYLLMQKQWKTFWQILFAQIVMLALFLPWIFLVPGQVQKIQNAFWTEQPGLLEVVQAAVNFIGSLYPTGVLLMVVSALSLILVVFVLLIFFRQKTIPDVQKRLFGILVFLTPAILFLVSYIMRPIFVPRGFVTSMLFFYGLGGITLASMKPKLARYLLGFTAAVVMLISLPAQYLFDNFPRSPYNTAIGMIGEQMTQDSIILHDNKLSYFPASIYHPDVRQIFLADMPGSTNDTYAWQSQQAMQIFPEGSPDDAVKGYKEVYFVVYKRTLEEYRSLGVETHPVIDWLNGHYHYADQTSFEDLLIYHYRQ